MTPIVACNKVDQQAKKDGHDGPVRSWHDGDGPLRLTYQPDGERARNPVAKARGRADHDRVSAMRFRHTAYLTERVAGSDHETCVDPVRRCDMLKGGPKVGFDVVLMQLSESDARSTTVRGSQDSADWMTDVDSDE
jgi:hypothetical protein